MRVTLGPLASFARWCYRIRKRIAVLAVLSAVGFGASVFAGGGAVDSRISLFALALLLWLLLLLGVAYALSRLPRAALPDDGWIARLRQFVLWLGYLVLALAAAALAVFSLIMSARLFGLWLA